MTQIIVDLRPTIEDVRYRMMAYNHIASLEPLHDVIFHELDCWFLGDGYRQYADNDLNLCTVCSRLRLTQEQREDVIQYADALFQRRIYQYVYANDHLAPDGWTMDELEATLVLIRPDWRPHIKLTAPNPSAGTGVG